ncbi:DUF7937 domain-containing protein [Brachybacterium sp. AOP25-B2-12]|uniref:DUF7937 domain-containing protein n=1 Tax=Brachybacterium sp. AOP25-B2-12 TaxID=3457710 RepID=UPI0040346430
MADRTVRPGDRPEDDDWIFPAADPGALPTERLPGRTELEQEAAALRPQARTGAPAAPRPSEQEEVGTDAVTVTYARSGTTPNAEYAPRRPVLALPHRFAALSWWDAVRDIVALVALCSAYTVVYTIADIGPWLLAPRIAIGLAVLALIVAHLLRWIPASPPLSLIRRVRVIGMAPAVLVALGTILADAVLSLPVLFSPLPDGPPVGVGVGVALLLLGALLGIEPRSHEGFVPGEVSRTRTRALLLVIAWVALGFLALALVMLVGRVFTTGWAFSTLAFGNTGLSALLLLLVIGAGLRRERTHYVFAVAAVAGLVLGAVTDNTLRLQFAAPQSVATGYVYLPWLFATFAVLTSRSFVRSMPISFRRADWIVYAVRALEFSVVMHSGAAVWSVLAAFASAGGAGRGGPVLHLVGAVVAALFAVMSSFGRRALLERHAESARATAVVAAIVMVVVGFLDIVVNSLATGAGAGLVTGGVALAIGIAVALMLTVPAPVRDEYGAPDIVQMFEDFRLRDATSRSLLHRVPDLSAERAEKKTFPGG